jgi:hypothetical protein
VNYIIKLSAVVDKCTVIYILHALTVLVLSACFFLTNVEDKKWNFSLYMLDQLFMKKVRLEDVDFVFDFFYFFCLELNY